MLNKLKLLYAELFVNELCCAIIIVAVLKKKSLKYCIILFILATRDTPIGNSWLAKMCALLLNFEFLLSWSLSTFLYIYALIVWYKTKRTWSNEEVKLLFIIFSFLCKQRHIHVACTLIVKPLQPRASLFRYYLCSYKHIKSRNQPFDSLPNSLNVYGESDKSLKLTLLVRNTGTLTVMWPVSS